ncbi:Alpha/Beta hydrolase protein [Umbelopsis sp. PMI_123]|nr:Alpha/Beta hydrolase protein [Umbelopsis sp. PMI_123]
MNRLFSIVVTSLACLTVASPIDIRDDSTTSGPRVSGKLGTYVGKYLSSFNQDVFLGMPYAQPPIGPLRFKNPEPYNQSWEGDRLAMDYGYSCYEWSKSSASHKITYNEDCLTINVIRPSGYTNGSLPVGLWIYGGSFQMGSSALDTYNLSYPLQQSVNVQTPIIAVSVNYRIGPLGFFTSSEMQQAGDLNVGLKDLVLALRWIQDNISAFGGDPTKVTIWGQSAGAEAVANLLTAYGGTLNGLFRGAIMESGSNVRLPHNYLPISTWQSQYSDFLSYTGCTDASDPLECIRSVAIDKILHFFDTSNHLTSHEYYPVVDGDFIQDWPKNLLAEKKFVKVPIITGANMDEGASFGPGNINTTDELISWLKNLYPSLEDATIDRLLELYPDDPALGSPFGTGDMYSGGRYGLQYKRGNALVGDFAMAGPRRLTCETWVEAGLDVYSYNWNQSDYNNPPEDGSDHAQEVVYVFDNPSDCFPNSGSPTIGPDPNGTKKLLADQISGFFMSFIATGDPNNAKLKQSVPAWPKYNITQPTNYYFHESDTHIEADDWRKDAIHFTNYEVGHQFNN